VGCCGSATRIMTFGTSASPSGSSTPALQHSNTSRSMITLIRAPHALQHRPAPQPGRQQLCQHSWRRTQARRCRHSGTADNPEALETAGRSPLDDDNAYNSRYRTDKDDTASVYSSQLKHDSGDTDAAIGNDDDFPPNSAPFPTNAVNTATFEPAQVPPGHQSSANASPGAAHQLPPSWPASPPPLSTSQAAHRAPVSAPKAHIQPLFLNSQAISRRRVCGSGDTDKAALSPAP
jgi:hypothetical protein